MVHDFLRKSFEIYTFLPLCFRDMAELFDTVVGISSCVLTHFSSLFKGNPVVLVNRLEKLPRAFQFAPLSREKIIMLTFYDNNRTEIYLTKTII